MGTHRSRHNKGRKAIYKDHRRVAATLLEKPAFYNRGHYYSRTWWKPADVFKLGILCEANSDIDGSADALGRPAKSLAYYARDAGLTLPREWLRIITPARAKSMLRIETAYPYITKVRDEHAELLAVNAVIPKSIPDNMRADICQEILLAILEGRTSLEALKAKGANASYYIKKFYHDNFEGGGHAISFQEVDEDWNSDAVASSIAAKEWHREQFAERSKFDKMVKTYTPAVQFDAAWSDQVGRIQLKSHELGQFLSRQETEELMEEMSEVD